MTRRLLVTYLMITALTLAVVVVPLGRIFAEREKSRLLFALERDAQNIGSLVEDMLESGVNPSIDDVLMDYRDSGARVVVVDRFGHSVADSAHIGGEPRDFSTRPEFAEALDGGRTSGTRRSDTLGVGLIYVAVPIASGGVVHGAIRVSYPTSTLDARIAATWWRLGVLSGVVLMIVAGVGIVIARGVTRPLRDLESASRRLAAGDLSVRVRTTDGAPEIRSLARTFNSSAVHLESLVNSQRRFVADASHQLRTPLTALRLRLETLEPRLDDVARPKLDAAIAETDRLARLVQSLLVLARGDAAVLGCIPVDLDEVVAGRIESWEPLALERGVSVSSVGTAGVRVMAAPDAVEQIIDNLLSNALDVAPAGSTVSIRVVVDSERVELHVVDQGPGMSADARSQAFERFWRGQRDAHTAATDAATSATNADGARVRGFGLGLAIVDQLSRQCGGTTRLADAEDGPGVDAVVVFDRAGSAG